ncbi:MAG: CPBP family intramembrane glutamic endopeptidase [Micropepsaceae bacterium]
MANARKVAISTGKILLYFVMLGMTVAGAVELALPALGLHIDRQASQSGVLLLSAINLLAMAVPAFLMAYLFDCKTPVAMGLTLRNAVPDFLAGGTVGVFIFVVGLAGAFLGGWAQYDPDFSKVSMPAMAIGALSMTLGAAGEEIMLRGYVLQELMSKFSMFTSVLVSSVIFAGLHLSALLHSPMALIGALNIFAASVLLSLAYLATRSLWLPIGIHMGWNFAQGPLLGINVSGNDFASGWHPVTLSGPEMMTGGSFGFEASLLGLAGPLLGMIMMMLFATTPEADADVAGNQP